MKMISHDSETPAFGQQVITACAFIHKKMDGTEKVFLPRRSTNRKFLPGVYEIPGGHIDFGEEIIAGLEREIKEETGKDISIGDPYFVFTYKNDIKGSHSIEVVFFAVFKGEFEIKLDPEKHSGFDWFGEKDLGTIIDSGKSEDDPEMEAIKKGFSLLKGAGLNFG